MQIKYLLLFGLMLLFTDCQKDDLAVQEEVAQTETVSNHISGEEAPDVVNYLDQLFNTESLKLGKINLPFSKKLIDKKTIAKVKDPETGYTNFTFAVKRKKKDNFLFQVAVTKYGKNNFSDPYIFKFKFDDAFRKKLNNGKADWSEYIWPIYPYNLHDAGEELEKSGSDCPPINPAPSGGGGTNPGGSIPDGPNGNDDSGITLPESCEFRITTEYVNVDWVDPSDHTQGFYSYDEVTVVEIRCDGKGWPAARPLLGNGDCPGPMEAPIGVIEPEEDILDIEANAFVNVLHAQGKLNWDIDRLKDDAAFKLLAGQTFTAPEGFMYPGEWNTIAANAYAVAYKKFRETTQGSEFNHTETYKESFINDFWGALSDMGNEVSELYDRVSLYLPQNSEEWLDMGGMFGELFLEVGIDFILPPGLSAAKAMADAFQEFENGSKLGAAFLAGVAIIEVTPWGKVGKAILNTGKAGFKAFKFFKVFKKLVNSASEGLKFLSKNDELLALSDDAYKLGLDAADAIEDAIQTTGKTKPSWSEVKALFKRGNDFNGKAVSNQWYDFHEIHLKNGKKLDSYDPDLKQIVSRKATDFNSIQKSTFEKYLKEFKSKYDRGTVIRSNKYPDLDGTTLQGEFILEVPNSNLNSSKLQEFRDIATGYDVTIVFKSE